MSNDRGARSTEVILNEALDELRAREARLEPFVAELANTKKAIGIMERALAPSLKAKPRASTVKGGRPASRNPRGEFRQRVADLLERSIDPLPASEIAQRLDSKDGDWFRGVLANMVTAGQIQVVEKDPDRYGLPVRVDTSARDGQAVG